MKYAYCHIDLSALDTQVLHQALASTKQGIDYFYQAHCFPLYQTSTHIGLIMGKAPTPEQVKALASTFKLSVEPIVATPDTLAVIFSSMQKIPPAKTTQSPQTTQTATPALEKPPTKTKTVQKPTVLSEKDIEDIPAILQNIIIQAIDRKASDLHFEPYETLYRVRFRVDGALQEVVHIPLIARDKLVSRIKIMSRLDISEKRLPQDGRMRSTIHGRVVDFRVSTLPTLFGEKVVMRILDASAAKLNIDKLGYHDKQKILLLEAIQRPYGMVLVTGPTGSGKTVSLYTCLNLLNQNDTNIMTVEDPVEINLPGINQVSINERTGLDFASALRAFLRQDPDIVMLGEIRDLETADIAIKAAQTGHLVLSTLHTNDAPSTLNRLINMGVAPFNIASSVHLITAQRLVRRLCSSCKQPTNLSLPLLKQAGFDQDLHGAHWNPYQATGCAQCQNSGYQGRVGIFQVMPISESMREIILAQGSIIDIERQAQKEGIMHLRSAGLQKVGLGLTSFEEVISATHA